MEKDIMYQFGYVLGELTAVLEKALPKIGGDKALASQIQLLVADTPSKIDPWLVELARMEQEVPGISKEAIIDTLDRYYNLLAQIDRSKYSTKSDQGFYFGFYHTSARQSLIVTRKRIGTRIKELRESKGLSQRELAGMADIGYPHLCRIEKGDYNVSVDILSRLGTALGVELTLS